MNQQLNPFDVLQDMEKSLRQMAITCNSITYAKFLDEEHKLQLENISDDIAQIFFRISDFNQKMYWSEKNLLTSQSKGDQPNGKN